MKPLIEIKTVPISIEFKVSAAKTQRSQATAEVEVTRNKKALALRADQYD